MKETNSAYGALLMTTVRALQKEGTFDEAHITNLESVLFEIVDWGKNVLFFTESEPPYLKPFLGLGQQIFGKQPQEAKERREITQKAMFDEWLSGLDEEQKEERKIMLDEDGEDSDDEDGLGDEKTDRVWHQKFEMYANYDHPEFEVTSTWKSYKGYGHLLQLLSYTVLRLWAMKLGISLTYQRNLERARLLGILHNGPMLTCRNMCANTGRTQTKTTCHELMRQKCEG